MFPFRFDKIAKPISNKYEFYKNIKFDDRVAINKEFKESLEKSAWEYKKFKIESNLDYNEQAYFYDFVKDALFNLEDFKKKATSYYFKKKISKNAQYIIKVIGNAPYILNLEEISLRVFDTGVAILSFEIVNYKYSNLKDIFNINEYGRRIYPQFIGEDRTSLSTKDTFLAEYLEVNGILEEFYGEYKEIKLAKFITKTLGETFTTSKKEKNKYLIQPVLDDRMYVMSHILSDTFSSQIKDELNDNWYEYIFLDKLNKKNIQNLNMQEELVKKHTYTRWQGYGTLYGVSRYSFVVLTNRDSFSDLILNHVKTLYYQMATLILANRASILRFSDEITALSDIEANKSLVDKISNLYKNFLHYKTRLYFKEITPQEQGIELYDLMREVTRIDRDISDLSIELDSLYNYASIIQEKQEQEEMAMLTKLGAIFLPPTLLAGMFGMNYIDFSQHNPIWALVATLAIILSAFFGYLMIQTKYKKTKIVILAIMIIVFGLFIYSYPINNSDDKNLTTMPTKLIKQLNQKKEDINATK